MGMICSCWSLPIAGFEVVLRALEKSQSLELANFFQRAVEQGGLVLDPPAPAGPSLLSALLEEYTARLPKIPELASAPTLPVRVFPLRTFAGRLVRKPPGPVSFLPCYKPENGLVTAQGSPRRHTCAWSLEGKHRGKGNEMMTHCYWAYVAYRK